MRILFAIEYNGKFFKAISDRIADWTVLHEEARRFESRHEANAACGALRRFGWVDAEVVYFPAGALLG